MPKFIEKSFKTIINKHQYIDSWFWCRYTINPFNGCLIACTYCDSRSLKYHMPKDFENEIIVKTNAADLLTQQIHRKKSMPRDVVVIGGTTDGYQAAEKKYATTRSILEVLAKYRFPVHIITKSDLVLRDTDLLKQISQEQWCTVSVTITSTDAQKSKFLERRAPTPQQRFELVKELRSQGIMAGVLFIPMIPWINDDEEQLESMVQLSSEAGANYLLFGGGMTLRDEQALHFLKHLEQDFPEAIPRYEQLYSFKYKTCSYSGTYTTPQQYLISKHERLLRFCKMKQLPYRIPRFIPRDHRALNYRLAEKWLNKAYLNQILGRKWKEDFWTGQHIQNLNENIADIANRSELSTINGIPSEKYGELERSITDLTED